MENLATQASQAAMSTLNSPLASACAQSCLTLCDPMDCSPPGSSVHGIFQARIWDGLPFPPPGDLPNSGIKPTSLVSPALAGGVLTTGATGPVPSSGLSTQCRSRLILGPLHPFAPLPGTQELGLRPLPAEGCWGRDLRVPRPLSSY